MLQQATTAFDFCHLEQCFPSQESKTSRIAEIVLYIPFTVHLVDAATMIQLKYVMDAVGQSLFSLIGKALRLKDCDVSYTRCERRVDATARHSMHWHSHFICTRNNIVSHVLVQEPTSPAFCQIGS